MNNRINVNEIMKELEDKIVQGLSEKSLTVTDISMLIGQYTEKATQKVLEDTSEILNTEVKPSDKTSCKECGKPLKKQKNKPAYLDLHSKWQDDY